jgi:antitoxin FitA
VLALQESKRDAGRRDRSTLLDMYSTCKHAHSMSPMIQIRHVPDALHRRLKARAAAAGMTLSDYLQVELERVASQLTPDEVRARLRQLEPVVPPERAADVVRAASRSASERRLVGHADCADSWGARS